MSVSTTNPNSSSVPTNSDLIPMGNEGTGSKAKASELFNWVKIYSSVALWSMASCMTNNSDAIQKYIYDGLNGLSLSVMKSSQDWSTWNMAQISAVNTKIINELASGDSNDVKSMKINAYTTEFNTDNTVYQQFLQWFNSMNDGINNTSSNTTQTQSQDNSNIQQGPIALLQTLTNIWTVIA